MSLSFIKGFSNPLMNIMKKHSFLSIIFFFIYPGAILCHEKTYEELELPGVVGPESIAFDCNGEGPYTGVSDGRILKWQGPELGWTEFAITAPNRRRNECDGSTDPNMEPTCGRPLGLKFNPQTCDLYIADAYFGLMVVGPNGGQAQQVAVSAEGVPFRFTNGLEIDTQKGVVYFTDSSTIYQRREYLLAFTTGDKTGRLLKYDPHSKKVTVMYKGLAFPNGVALSKDNSFLLVSESTKLRVLRLWLQDSTTHTPQTFVQLPGIPDNIERNSKGEFWVALNIAKAKTQINQKDPVGIKLDGQGNIVKFLYGNDGEALESVSEVEEHGGRLYIGSSMKPYVGVDEV